MIRRLTQRILRLNSRAVFLALIVILIVAGTSCKNTIVPPADSQLSLSFNGGRHDNTIQAPIPTADGGYLVFGLSKSNANGRKEIFIMKLDASHREQWYKTFFKSQNELVNSAMQLADGGYIISSSILTADLLPGDTNLPGTCIYLIRTDKNGDSVWTRTYMRYFQNKLYSDIPTTLCQDKDNNIYVGASSGPAIQDPSIVTVLKIKSSGDVQSFRVINSKSTLLCGMFLAQDGNFVARAAGFAGQYVLKFDTSCTLITEKLIYKQLNASFNDGGMTWKEENGHYTGTDNITGKIMSGALFLGYKYNICAYSVSTDLSSISLALYDSFSILNYSYDYKVTAADAFNNGLLAEAVPISDYTGFEQMQGSFNLFIRDGTGKILVSKIFEGWPYSITHDEKGNLFVVGLSLRPLSNARNIFTLYLNSKGEIIN